MKILFLIFISVCVLKAHSQNNIKLQNIDSVIVSMLEMVNPDSLKSYVIDLQNFGTRFMMAPNRKEVAEWLADKFMSFGITEVRLDSFQCYTNIDWSFLVYDTITWQYNVEAKIQGTDPSYEVLVIGHYDCITTDYDPMDTIVPGANDNASGTVAMLECARILMETGYQPKHTIVFLPTAAEELMYFGNSGAKHYAAQCVADNRNLLMVINNDMIGWDYGNWTVSLRTDTLSQKITDLAIYIIENYTTLNYIYADFWTLADLEPFINSGFKGIYFMEDYSAQFYPYYHTIYDLYQQLNYHYHAEITKITLGLLLKSYELTAGTLSSPELSPKLSLFPNPVKDILNIITTIDCDFISIYNSSGLLLDKFPFTKTVEMQHYPDGLYFLVFNTNDNNIIKNVVVAK